MVPAHQFTILGMVVPLKAASIKLWIQEIPGIIDILAQSASFWHRLSIYISTASSTQLGMKMHHSEYSASLPSRPHRLQQAVHVVGESVDT